MHAQGGNGTQKFTRNADIALSHCLITFPDVCLANCNFASHRTSHNVTPHRYMLFISKTVLILAKHTYSPLPCRPSISFSRLRKYPSQLHNRAMRAVAPSSPRAPETEPHSSTIPSTTGFDHHATRRVTAAPPAIAKQPAGLHLNEERGLRFGPLKNRSRFRRR